MAAAKKRSLGRLVTSSRYITNLKESIFLFKYLWFLTLHLGLLLITVVDEEEEKVYP